jgi:diguanylate cyclase (GGDEF)-like protein/PAS domain S-box-containing protein
MLDRLHRIFASVRSTPFRPISLCSVFVIPSTLLILLTVAVTGYISFRNGQRAVNDVARQLRTEITLRIEQHLLTFLEIPHQINQYNAEAIRTGALDVEDAGTMQAHFLRQVRTNPSITSVYFGNVDGGIIGSGREGADGRLYVYDTENLQSGVFNKFGVDEMGNVDDLLVTLPDFDARTRPWYIGASQKGDAVWSEIYVLFTGQDMAIAASRPVYDKRQNLIGVVSVDIFLSQLSRFLETLDVGSQGQIFIMERSGMLVATSTGEAMFTDKNGDDKMERMDASDSSSALIRQSANFLLETYRGYQNIPRAGGQLELVMGGERQFLQFSLAQDRYGIDWIVIVVVPESAFMEQINASNRATMWIILAAVIVSVGGSVVITTQIAAGITQLNKSAQKLAKGEWEHEIEVDSRIGELNELASSFNQMRAQLRRTLENLTGEINERERAAEALRESEKRYRLIAQHAEDIIWTTDMELRLTYVSPSLERVLGYSAEEIIAFPPEKLLTPESLASSLKAFSEEVAAAQPEPDPNYARVLEMEYCRKNGSTFWTEMKFSFFRDTVGQPIGVLGVGRDITHRKRVEKALNQRIKELQSLQATVLEITAPHELSNLLYTIVQRAADLLEAGSGGLYLCDSERQEARCVVSYNTPKDFTGVILKYGEGAAGYVAQSGEPLIVDDYRTWSGGANVFCEEKPFERLVSAPMLWQGQVIGIIHVLRAEGDAPFTYADLKLLSHFAQHAAIAVANTRQLESLEVELTERKRAEERLNAYARQITLLNELTRAALEQSNLHETFQMLADRLGKLLEADGAYITLWDETQQRAIPVTAYGSMREEYSVIQFEPGEKTLTEAVLSSGHALVVEDVFNTPYLSSRIAGLFPTRSMLALPMIAGQQKLGAALIAFNQSHHFTQEEIALGEQTARQIALVVARLRTLQEAQRLAHEQSLLFRAARDFSAGLDEERVLSAIVHHMTAVLQVDGCTISRYEPEQGSVVTLLDYDNSPYFRPDPVGKSHFLTDYPSTLRVLESRQPLIILASDPNADPAELTVLEQYGYTTMMMLPLAVGDRVSGLVELSRRSDTESFSDDDVRLAQSLANTAAVALENGRLLAEVQTLAVTDNLTGLANRRAFDRTLESEIARATRYDQPVALLFLDVDSFKQYNDSYGHPAGDERLKAIAHLLQSNIRQPDLVARYGGEEFVILLPSSNKVDALTLAERLRAAAENAYRLFSVSDSMLKNEIQHVRGNQAVPGYTISIGVAVCPEDAQTPDELLNAADKAVMAAKRRGKNRVCVAPISTLGNS